MSHKREGGAIGNSSDDAEPNRETGRVFTGVHKGPSSRNPSKPGVNIG